MALTFSPAAARSMIVCCWAGVILARASSASLGSALFEPMRSIFVMVVVTPISYRSVICDATLKGTNMTKLIAAAVVLTLAGCCSPGEDACTQAQNNALAGIIAGGGAPYQPYRAPAPVFVSCTHTGIMTNCIGQ